ncbi:MAG: hypothetical protein Kow0029_12730 [Candidatus Rifleibacteriota bacterium]
MFKKSAFVSILLIVCAFISYASFAEIFTPIEDILANPASFEGKYVTVKGHYFGWHKAPGGPPVTRSDWVITDENDKAIYCTGNLPQSFDPFAKTSLGKPITVLARVKCKNNKPYLEIEAIRQLTIKVEKMVSVAQIIFDPVNMRGQYVGLLGVLAKGYGVKGERMYLLADPTGAIKLGRLPKLYPTGTILHLRGYIKIDENGLPMLDNIEIVSAKVD